MNEPFEEWGNSPGAGAVLSIATGSAHGVRRSYLTIVGLEIGPMAQQGQATEAGPPPC